MIRITTIGRLSHFIYWRFGKNRRSDNTKQHRDLTKRTNRKRRRLLYCYFENPALLSWVFALRNMDHIFLSSYSPIEKISIGEANITKEKRVSLTNRGRSSYYDSIRVLSDLEGEEFFIMIRDWIVFHSFILNSSVTLTRYQEEDFSADELIVRGECVNMLDYTDIIAAMYRITVTSHVSKLSYCELFEKYLSLKKEDKEIIKNFLTITELGGEVMSTSKQITDISYWKLVGYYSVIEKILGRQDYCKVKFDCKEACERDDLMHHSMSYADWIRRRVSEIISSTGVSSQYADIIVAVYKNVRNPTAHEGLFPSAEFIQQEPGTEIEFDVNRSMSEYKKDKSALLSTLVMTQEIARNLLSNYLFKTEVFPFIEPLISASIVLGKSRE